MAKKNLGIFVCRQCRKPVQPVRGRLKCCGITESVKGCVEANDEFRELKKRRTKELENKIFDPVLRVEDDNWDGDPDEDPYLYAGIPNSD
jgi:hypothetical protein